VEEDRGRYLEESGEASEARHEDPGKALADSVEEWPVQAQGQDRDG
jgi:hypothetical protein